MRKRASFVLAAVSGYVGEREKVGSGHPPLWCANRLWAQPRYGCCVCEARSCGPAAAWAVVWLVWDSAGDGRHLGRTCGYGSRPGWTRLAEKIKCCA